MQPKEERAPETVIVAVGETRGWLEPCGCTEGMMGGIARRAALMDRLRGMGQLPHLVDLGDVVKQPGRQTELKLDALLEAYRVMGVAALAIGDLDVMIGLDTMARFTSEAGVPVLGSNLRAGEGQEGAIPEGIRTEVMLETAVGPVPLRAYLAPGLGEDVSL
ncbi:MAG: hypothetical protein ACYTFT_09575, partial [Planctomycetota bacterium]